MATNIPSPILVGGKSYSVAIVDTLFDDMGEIQHHKHLINLSADQVPAEMRDTVLHEVLHAVVQFVGLPYDNEEVVSAITSTLLMVLRDNPALVTFLTAVDA